MVSKEQKQAAWKKFITDRKQPLRLLADEFRKHVSTLSHYATGKLEVPDEIFDALVVNDPALATIDPAEVDLSPRRLRSRRVEAKPVKRGRKPKAEKVAKPKGKPGRKPNPLKAAFAQTVEKVKAKRGRPSKAAIAAVNVAAVVEKVKAKRGRPPKAAGAAGKQSLKQLGQNVAAPTNPNNATIECIPNPHKGARYMVRFTCPEFTSICPVTGQPDFAHLVIDYVPSQWIVESKSLKLYLGSYRNHGAFHEDCTIAIAQRLVKELKPAWLRIGGYWFPRGGIPIDVFYQTGEPPAGVWLAEQEVPGYRGRG